MPPLQPNSTVPLALSTWKQKEKCTALHQPSIDISFIRIVWLWASSATIVVAAFARRKWRAFRLLDIQIRRESGDETSRVTRPSLKTLFSLRGGIEIGFRAGGVHRAQKRKRHHLFWIDQILLLTFTAYQTRPLFCPVHLHLFQEYAPVTSHVHQKNNWKYPEKNDRFIDIHWISSGYHTFKRWPIDIYRILCACWVCWAPWSTRHPLNNIQWISYINGMTYEYPQDEVCYSSTYIQK